MTNLFNTISNIDLWGILSYFISSDFQKTLLPVKIVFLLLTAILLGIIIFTISRTHYFQWLTYQDMKNFMKVGSIGAKKITTQ